nr:hypothetical protein [Schaalia vaccimaxillae]
MHRRLIAIAAVSILACAGCNAGDLVVPPSQMTPQSGSSEANLDNERISAVLSETEQVLVEADEQKDASILAGRVDEAALRVRTAQYAYSNASGDSVEPLDLTPQTVAITNSSSWPRAIFNISESGSSQLPVVQILVQDDARSEYRLTNWARLLGSTQLTLAPAESGSSYVGGNASGFVMTPDEAVVRYIEMLNSGSPDSQTFTSDEFTTNYFETTSKLNKSVEAAGKVSAAAQETEYPVSGILTKDGSALVAANLTYTLTYERTVAGSTMRLGGQTAVLNSGDDDTVAGKATATYVATILMRIPSAQAGGQIQIVGADRFIESVSLDGSSNPDQQG